MRRFPILFSFRKFQLVPRGCNTGETDSVDLIDFMHLEMTILAKVAITRHTILMKVPNIADY